MPSYSNSKARAGYTLSPAMTRFLESSAGLLDAPGREPEADCEALTADNPRQQSRLAVLGPLIDSRISDLTRISNIRKDKGFAVAVVAGRSVTSESEAHTTQIDNLLAEVENEERSLLDAAGAEDRASAASSNRIILYGNLLGFALAAVCGDRDAPFHHQASRVNSSNS